MAWLEKRGDGFHLGFRFGDQKFKKSLKTNEPRLANLALARVERRLELIEQGEVEIPHDVDFATFVLSDGKLARPVTVKAMTLQELLKQYEAALQLDRLEPKTIETIQLHLKHIREVYGRTFRTDGLSFRDLQRYVDTRSRDVGHRGRPISAVTIKKELATFRGAWNWGVRMDFVRGIFPSQGLYFPKTTEKPPFQTRAAIERQIAMGGLNQTEQQDLWDCLYLTLDEVDEVLEVVCQRALHEFVHPMVLFAAHTGARRSEITRALTTDFEFESGFVVVHEKKRVRGKTTTRKAPMSEQLQAALTSWLKNRSQRLAFTNGSNPITAKDATHHLNWTLKGSRWECIRGWHVFRHSFISNCASKGVDQRMIDAWVGHTTEEMRRRYRHLLPDAQQAALASVFGGK